MDWQQTIETLCQDTTRFFWNRKLFRAVQAMFQSNLQLRSVGGPVWVWLVQLYSKEALLMLRRVLDPQSGTISLVQLLHQMEQRPDVLTRRRHRALYVNIGPTFADDVFGELGGPPGPGGDDDQFPAAVIRADRQTLEAKAEKPLRYANRMVAHRTRTENIDLTLDEIETALKEFLRVFRKYFLLITGNNLAGATPTPQFDWHPPFKVPWITTDFVEPDDDET